jgi:hypothetical protein
MVVAGIILAIVRQRRLGLEALAKATILVHYRAIVLDDQRLAAGTAFEGFVVSGADHLPRG